MTDGINELDDLIQRAASTPWGKTCSSLWAQAAALAEESGDMKKAVRCYGELCAAYMMGGESTRVIAPFMWLDQMFKTAPEHFEEQDVQALGWYYKYVVSTLRCVPTVSVSQCDALLDEMRQYYMQHGDSMRAYHIRCYQFHRDMGQTDAAELSYVKWQNAEHSELSDCERCDPGYEVLYHAGRGEWDQAVAAGDKALAHDGDYCDSQPEALLTEMMEPWLRVGRDAEAWAAHIRAYRRYQQHPRYFEFLQDHWEYLALSGRAGRPERLERGLTILLRHMPWWTEAEHPRLLMDSAVSAFILLDSFQGETRQRVLPTTLPGRGLAWAPREDVENPTIDQAAEWMKRLALDIAAQFDARPGHRCAGADTERILRRLNPAPVEGMAPAPAVEDVTGLGAYESTLTILRPDAAVGVPQGQASGRADADMALGTEEQSNVASFEHEAGVASSPSESAQGNSEQTDTVPLVLSNEWHSLSPVELLARSWSIARGVSTIYSLELGARIRRDMSLLSKISADLPEHLTEAWQWLRVEMDLFDELEGKPEPMSRASDDEAYALIIQAREFLGERDFYQAAATADRATRVDSQEPIGVRYEALHIMGFAAFEAGYLDESVSTVRECVNLAALLGLENEQLVAMWYLATVLNKARKFVEAAEVAQNALDMVGRFPEMTQWHVRLLAVAAQANEGLAYFDAAAAYHYQAAQKLSESGEIDPSIGAYRAAGEAFEKAQDFPRAIEAQRATIPLIRQLLSGSELELELADPADEENVERLRANVLSGYQALDRALAEYALTIVHQPGQVPAADMEQMEEAMRELLVMRTNPDLDKYYDKDRQWRHAEWRSDYAFMLWNCYQYTNAMDEQRASIQGFLEVGDIARAGRYTLALAYMCHSLGDLAGAREHAQRVVELLADKRFIGNEDRRAARKLLKELEQANPGE